MYLLLEDACKTSDLRGSFLNDQCTSTHNISFCLVFWLGFMVCHLEHMYRVKIYILKSLKNKSK